MKASSSDCNANKYIYNNNNANIRLFQFPHEFCLTIAGEIVSVVSVLLIGQAK